MSQRQSRSKMVLNDNGCAPCPFCGHLGPCPTLVIVTPECKPDFAVICQSCDARGPWAYKKKIALDFGNNGRQRKLEKAALRSKKGRALLRPRRRRHSSGSAAKQRPKPDGSDPGATNRDRDHHRELRQKTKHNDGSHPGASRANKRNRKRTGHQAANALAPDGSLRSGS